MLPKTAQNATAHRKHKRSLEIGLTIDCIAEVLPRTSARQDKTIHILEFGCGNGFQLPYLKTLGDVVACDVDASDGIWDMDDVRFVQCSIDNTGFDDAQFDLIFSNHVIEHLDNPTDAFRELKRIGVPACIYAFTVPTNVWLLLTIPEQYREKLHRLRRAAPARVVPSGSEKKIENAEDSDALTASAQARRQTRRGSRLMRRLMPAGHGVIADFWECYNSFKIANWDQFFREYGFSVVGRQPLLLYGPSEWPVIPTRPSFKNICSSVLFLLQKP
jgi:SAM-dependent methyltransferase